MKTTRDHILKFSEKITEIERDLNLKFARANTFSHFSKITQDNFSRYLEVFAKKGPLDLIIKGLTFLPIISANLLLSFGFRFLASNRVVSPNEVPSDLTVEWLILSHHNKQHSPEDYSDQFFGDILNDLASDQTPVHIYLLNHTGHSAASIQAQYPTNTKRLVRHVNPRGVRFLVNLSVHFEVFSNCVSSFFKTLIDTNTSTNEKALRLQVLIHQTHKSTLGNIFLMRSLSELINKISPRRILLTLEGHAHEVFIRDEILKISPKTRFYFYQHAPIVPDQFGLWNSLKLLESRDQVFVTGPGTGRYISQKVPGLKAQLHVLGSIRNHSHLQSAQAELYSNTSRVILFAPEAFEAQVLEFKDLALLLGQSFPNLEFRIRLHPATPGFSRLAKNLRHIVSTNVIYSDKRLTVDLEESAVCVYQSSSVAIEGLFYGVTPVHFTLLPEFNLDPLAPTFDKHFSCSNYSSLHDAIETVMFADHNIKSKKIENKKDLASQYFATFNSGILRDS